MINQENILPPTRKYTERFLVSEAQLVTNIISTLTSDIDEVVRHACELNSAES